jgi:DNA-binding MarR family transcriptional regulator
MSRRNVPARSETDQDALASLRAALTAELQAYQASVDAFDDAAAQWLGVTRTDLRCLEILVRDRTASPGALGSALGLTSGGVTAMLIRLERGGFLRRVPAPGDRRRVTVEVTDRTLRFAERFYGPVARDGAGILGRYDATELRLLSDFLHAARELQERHLGRVKLLPPAAAEPG